MKAEWRSKKKEGDYNCKNKGRKLKIGNIIIR